MMILYKKKEERGNDVKKGKLISILKDILSLPVIGINCFLGRGKNICPPTRP